MRSKICRKFNYYLIALSSRNDLENYLVSISLDVLVYYRYHDDIISTRLCHNDGTGLSASALSQNRRFRYNVLVVVTFKSY